ncbi:MAG: peptidoglycan-associated lipoprotein Pal [Rhodospirillales bacterium]|nr:peptidoglycan-associated lipoprotein Pal [Rhodospirillales bacterium]MSP79509.1 peptidoglycan-associated lipoprotein Pal [Rhodospirillales bacterium]
MFVRFLSMLTAVALVAACETAPEGGAGAAGAGAVVPGSQQDLIVNVGDRTFFDFDKFNLKPAAQRTLERQAAWLKRYPNIRVLVAGNCDERGTREYNLALGERRANSAKTYLVSQGIAADRIRTISYGKERPTALGSNEAAWGQNRNAITSVVSGAAGS